MGAVPMSGKGSHCPPCSADCGKIGCGGKFHCANGPGLGGPCRGCVRVTKFKPESESLFDSLGNWQSLSGAGPGCASDLSFTGNQDSSNFTSWEI